MWIIIKALGYFVEFLELMILIRVIMSWVPNARYSRFYDIVYSLTEPILGPVRDLMFRYLNTGPIDFSPIIAYFLIKIVYQVLVRILIGVAF
ncbi:YggT family protein [Tepidibacter formicigenes]|jgi:YggT family protein|uniref:YggT family protein n=1 Tax=Tepidibacter formicigenes DSM 15518 TaxID=1123349 RepID=A0A1M6KEB7_9FIRM|nr:YggT family protein [Tepidibacter formicigenes]SHJ57315.1 YggT family protein [Tepidibacter formicigenes DSM 15518]